MSTRIRKFRRRRRFTTWTIVLCMSLSGLQQIPYACASDVENDSSCCCAATQSTPECCAASQVEASVTFPGGSVCGCEINPASFPQLVRVLETRVRDLLSMLSASAFILHATIDNPWNNNGNLNTDSIAACGRIVPIYRLGSVYRL